MPAACRCFPARPALFPALGPEPGVSEFFEFWQVTFAFPDPRYHRGF